MAAAAGARHRQPGGRHRRGGGAGGRRQRQALRRSALLGRASVAAGAASAPGRSASRSAWATRAAGSRSLPSDSSPHQLHARQSPPRHRPAGRIARDDRRRFVERAGSGADVRLPAGRAGHAAERPGPRRVARQCDRGRQALVLNDSLRFHDEFVRHKILDLVGDLAVLGRAVLGHVVGRNAGHALNHELVAAIQQASVAARRAPGPRSRRQHPRARVVTRGRAVSLPASPPSDGRGRLDRPSSAVPRSDAPQGRRSRAASPGAVGRRTL